MNEPTPIPRGRNRYPGKCANCRRYVPTGTGNVRKLAGGKWVTTHLTENDCRTAKPMPQYPKSWRR